MQNRQQPAITVMRLSREMLENCYHWVVSDGIACILQAHVYTNNGRPGFIKTGVRKGSGVKPPPFSADPVESRFQSPQ